MAKEKKIAVNVFRKGVDTDTDDTLIDPGSLRFMLNCRIFGVGTKGKVVSIAGSVLIPNLLPAGNNTCIGWGSNEEKSKFYWFNYNDQGYHAVYCYNDLTGTVIPVLQNLIDTNNVDIFGLDPDYLINHVDIIADDLIYWVDGLNKARKFNLTKALDKSSTGYGMVVTEDFITAYKQCGVYAPLVVYFTDLTRTSNYLYALQFKVAYRFYYDDNEIGNWGDYSSVALPPNESYLGAASITFANNGINVTVATGNKLVTKIEIAVKINDLDWVGCAMLNKAQLGINDYAVYTFAFYNDGAYWDLDQTLIARPYSFLPRIPFVQSFVKIAMTYGNFNEGFAMVNIIAMVAVTYTPFYLPPETVSQLNNPVFTNNLLSISQHGGAFNSWWTTVTHFEVGHDVVKGNVFSIVYTGGNGGGQYLNYHAGIGDSATTVASAIKQYLLLIDAVGTGTISNEAIDGSGNVTWDFTIEAHEGKPAITFQTFVNPVNTSTLLDNGLSIPTIKQGNSRKYALVYEDDDGRTSLSYTCDALLAITQFETETVLGQSAPIGLQQPIHTISILNLPPVWAKYWRLVRTQDNTGFIQLLIQQVVPVVVENQPTYLDLVIGSLFAYQNIHPDTILTYEFLRGDRLRLVSNENTSPPTLYTPLFETEVLGYSVDSEIPINANINTTIGASSDHVTPSDGVKTAYVGLNIIIQGVERTIVSIDGTDYVLNEPITLAQASSSEVYTVPNYTIVDRRGVVRISMPPPAYNVVDFSLVEIYHPQANTNDGVYQNFFDFQQKFIISNWGTPNAAHQGNIQNQDPANPATTPAIVQVTQGDAYVRYRAMPSNNQNPNPQVIIDQICDPNFSDFYQSNLYSTGRVYPQDQGYGVTYFGSRERFSSNFLQNTQVNGLNDFNDLDRKDYDDPYGVIMRSLFLRNVLYLFKPLKTTWTPVAQNIITDNNGNPQLVTSDELLNDLQYAVWEGGIGNNPESIVVHGDYIYISSSNSGVFLRIAHDGSVPISQVYLFDKRAKEILALVNKYNLRLFGGYDKLNDEVLWSTPDFIQYLFNNAFNSADWQTTINAYPDGTTWTITQQPANSTATVVDGIMQITDTSILGPDLFKFQGTKPGGVLTPIINFCFTVVAPVNRQLSFRIKTSTDYCEQVEGENDGNQGWTILEGFYLDDNSLTGFIMPNIPMISPEAIVPSSATITYNFTNVTPTGGSNGDIWYNQPADALYKNVSGSWFLLTDRVVNANYAPVIYNITACPLPTPPPGDVDLTPNITETSPGGDMHCEFDLDGTLTDEITITYGIQGYISGTPYDIIPYGATAIIPIGDLSTADIHTEFDPGTTNIAFTYDVSPNPAGGVTVNFTSPYSIEI